MSSLLSILFMITGVACAFVALSFPFYLVYGIVYMLVLHKKEKASFNIVYLIVSFILFIVTAYMYGQLSAARPRAMLRMCEANCRNIGTALEMYAADNDAHYPGRLEQLTPDYIKYLPKCGTEAKHRYTDSYETDMEHQNYTFCCKGDNHIIRIRVFDIPVTGNLGAVPDYPRYSKKSGLIVKLGNGTEEK
ncbi:MAG: hypothetical protein AB2L14_21590 [Candidatus Xenobiia bacterium LiM19]